MSLASDLRIPFTFTGLCSNSLAMSLASDLRIPFTFTGAMTMLSMTLR